MKPDSSNIRRQRWLDGRTCPSRSGIAGAKAFTGAWALFALLAVSTQADPVTKERAAKAAATFVAKTYPAPANAKAKTITKAGSSHLGMKKTEALTHGGDTVGFVSAL